MLVLRSAGSRRTFSHTMNSTSEWENLEEASEDTLSEYGGAFVDKGVVAILEEWVQFSTTFGITALDDSLQCGKLLECIYSE